jgi:hypothetical protein
MNMRKTNTIITLSFAFVLVLSVLSTISPVAKAAGPCSETTYANGQLFCIFIAKIITNPSPGLLAAAEPLYIASYSLLDGCGTGNPTNCGAETLPSGYQPLCNPCFHGGALNKFPYHDHVISGAPGFGNDGTAGVMKGPWFLKLVAYNPTHSNTLTFTPFKSTSAIVAGESSGDFLQLKPGASNPFEINTGVVIIFGVQPLG